jgi:hypothetical protein
MIAYRGLHLHEGRTESQSNFQKSAGFESFGKTPFHPMILYLVGGFNPFGKY